MNFGDFERPPASPKKALVSAAGLLADLASRSSWTLSRGQFEIFLDEAAAFGAPKSSLRDDFASNRLVRGLDAQTPPRPLASETASGTWALSPFAIARLAAANWRERLPPAAARTLLDAYLLRLEAALPPGRTLLRACVGGSLARSLLADPSAPPDFGDVDLALSFSVDGSIVGEADLSPQRRGASELRWAAHGAPLAKLGLSSDPDERSYLDDPKPIGIHAIAWLGPKAVVFDARAGGRFAVPEPFFGPIPVEPLLLSPASPR